MPFLPEQHVSCPYCGESILVTVDTSQGNQQYYEDCQVCCAPIVFDLFVHYDGGFTLKVKRDDE